MDGEWLLNNDLNKSLKPQDNNFQILQKLQILVIDWQQNVETCVNDFFLHEYIYIYICHYSVIY